MSRHRPAALLGAALVTVLAAALATLTPAVAAQRGPSDTKPAATKTRVVRPVTATGAPAAGWSVRRLKGRVDCSGSSAAAVDDGITTCYPTALYLPSCWRSARHTVLCVRDVATRRLVRIHYSGAYPSVAAPARPSPQRLVLRTGSACSIRIGGAWGSPPSHPDWVGFYSCDRGSVYGPATGDGIGRRHPAWRVSLLLPGDRVILRRVVKRAVFVGTAG